VTADLGALQDRLQAAAVAEKREWWEAYLKGAIEFRGTPMAAIRSAVHAWWPQQHITGDPVQVALDLVRCDLAEDKLAGILLLQEILIPDGAVRWEHDLARFAGCFDDGSIADWSSCDWFCVKVLGPLVVAGGRPCAEAITSWGDAPGLWRRRASCVAFANLAAAGDDNFPGFTDLVLDACSCLVADEERFAQTGVGWVVREISRADPERAIGFVANHAGLMSAEGLRYATAKLEASEQARLRSLRKQHT